ncbi:fimbrial biogenesis chaperone [Sessilibacter corallicola]|uniref:Pili assembly chaperone N-terminal domain-containing protein n=1 Tax=Sessilibacter corallicola TaxID=2904075 RepID=A0ABQ0A4S7_9GAMM
MRFKKVSALYFCSIFIVFFSANTFSFGDLTVTPTRVIFEGRERAKTISLVNRGTKVSTFRIEFSEMSMDEYGGLKEIKEPKDGQKFSSDFIKFAPRQVTIEPGKSQTVRLLVRKPSGLPEGEYRSHLVMYAVPDSDQNAISLENFSELKEKEVGFQVSAIIRVAIPVIIREGELEASFEISDVEINNLDNLNAPISPELKADRNFAPNITFDLSRKGNRSVYANVDVLYKDNANPESQYLIGSLKDYVVYVPNSHRVAQIPLDIPSELKDLNGTVDVIFYKSEEGDKEILAKSTVDI